MRHIKQFMQLYIALLRPFAKMDAIKFRSVIYYFWKNGKKAEEIHQELLSTEGNSAPNLSFIYRWIHNFKCGRMDVLDEKPGGQPYYVISEVLVAEVKKLVDEDGRATCSWLADTLGYSKSTIQRILHDHLEYRKLSARWVPRMLTDAQRARRVECSRLLKEIILLAPEEFVLRYVTVDETWIYYYDPESKQQSKQWKPRGSNPPLKFKAQRSADKVLATIFWDADGIIFIDYLEKGKTINGAYYANLIRRLRQELIKKRRGKVTRGVLLHQDNAPPHTSQVAKAAIEESGFQLIDHPPYSPDMAPSDYFLFPNLKSYLRGKRFESNYDVISCVNEYFEGKDKSYFREGVLKLEKCCDKCVEVEGHYIEK